MKKLSLCVYVLFFTLSGGLSSSSVFAQDVLGDEERVFLLKRLGSDKMSLPAEKPKWMIVDTQYSGWVDGDVGQCEVWTPDPSIIDEGSAFDQARACEQLQQRTRIDTLKSERLNKQRIGTPSQESRTITVSQTQGTVGTRPVWFATEPVIGAWQDTNGTGENTSAWLPLIADQDSTFIQARSVQNIQTRTNQPRERHPVRGEERNAGEATTETRLIDGSEVREVVPSNSTWSISEYVSCDNWMPMSDKQESNFSQSQNCDVIQSRTLDYSVGDVVLSSTSEDKTTSITQSRNVNVALAQWATASRSNSEYFPVESQQVEDYVQSRNAILSEERLLAHTVSSESVYQSTQKRDRNVIESRNVSVSITPLETGAIEPISDWEPVFDSQVSTFSQTRNIARRDSVEAVHKVDGAVIHTSAAFNEVNPTSQSRDVVVSATTAPANGEVDYTEWLPDFSGQSRNFRQYRTRSQRDSDQTLRFSVEGQELYTWVRPVTSPQDTESRQIIAAHRFLTFLPERYIDSSNPWRPVAENQTSNFTQRATVTKTEIRERFYKVHTFNEELAVHRYAITSSESKSRVVAVSNQVMEQSDWDYNPWHPKSGGQTSSYSQSRSVQINYVREYTYSTDVGVIGSYVQTTAGTKNENRTLSIRSTVVDQSPYTYTTTWHPRPSHTSSRYLKSFSQSRSRSNSIITRYDHYDGSVDNIAFTEDKNTTSDSTESRNLSFSKEYQETTVSTATAWSYGIIQRNYQTGSYNQSRYMNFSRPVTYTWKTPENVVVDDRVVNEYYSENQSRRVNLIRISNELVEYAVTDDYSPAITTQTGNFYQNGKSSSVYLETFELRTATAPIIVIDTGTRAVTTNSSISRHVRVGTRSADEQIKSTDWSPAISDEAADFTQTRSLATNPVTEYFYFIGSDVANPIHTRLASDDAVTESRVVNVVVSSGEEDTQYTTWTEELLDQDQYRNSSFYQYRSKNDTKIKKYTYSIDGVFLSEREVPFAETTKELRRVTARKEFVENGTDDIESSWSPAFDNQTINFSQSRSVTKSQDLIRSYYIFDDSKPDNLGEFVTQTTLKGTPLIERESRTLDVQLTETVNRPNYNSSPWEPELDGQASTFVQRQEYFEDMTKTYRFVFEGDTIHSHTIDYTRATYESRIVSVNQFYRDISQRDASDWNPVFDDQLVDYTQRKSVVVEKEFVTEYTVDDDKVGERIDPLSTVTSLTRLITVTGEVVDGASGGEMPWGPVFAVQKGDFTQTRNIITAEDTVWVHALDDNEVYRWVENTGSMSNTTESRNVAVVLTDVQQGPRVETSRETLDDGTTQVNYRTTYRANYAFYIDGENAMYDHDDAATFDRDSFEITP